MSGNYRIRSLDPAERFIWLLDRISCANFLVMAELAGHPIDEETLRRGLDRLQANHPLLSARIVEHSDGTIAYYREEGARLPLSVGSCDEADWPARIAPEFNARFEQTGQPLARCHLLKLPTRSVLSITFHHAIGDARSGSALLKDLLRSCLRGHETAAQATPPAMHSLFPAEFEWREHPDKAKAIGAQMAEEFIRHGMPDDLPFLTHQQAARRPRLKQVRLEPTLGLRFQERCRAEGASVHGAICAAHLIATRNLFGDAEPRVLYLMCPVDMRPRVEADLSHQLSYCTTFLRSNYLIDGSPQFWPLAREIGKDMKRRLERGDGHLTYASLPLDKIGGSGATFDAFAADVDRLPAGSNISNIGRVEPLDDCPEVQTISFALCSLPKHLASLNVSSYRDELIVNMTFDAAKLEPEMADRLADDLNSQLAGAAVAREVRPVA